MTLVSGFWGNNGVKGTSSHAKREPEATSVVLAGIFDVYRKSTKTGRKLKRGRKPFTSAMSTLYVLYVQWVNATQGIRVDTRAMGDTVVQYIAKNMGGYVESFLGKHSLQKSDMDFWAIHPGGRRIIEEAQNGLGLSEEQAKYSWNVLSNYGNMLSPSVMFVLELILNDHKKALAKGERGLKQGIAFSFSPGVGAEGVLIKVM